jgi:hypothetical protein
VVLDFEGVLSVWWSSMVSHAVSINATPAVQFALDAARRAWAKTPVSGGCE